MPAPAAAVAAEVHSNGWVVVEGGAAARGGVDAGEGKGFGNVKDDIAKGRFISSGGSTPPTCALNALQKLSSGSVRAIFVLNSEFEQAIPVPLTRNSTQPKSGTVLVLKKALSNFARSSVMISCYTVESFRN